MKSLLKNKWIWMIGGVVLLIGLFVSLRPDGRRAIAQAETNETAVVFIGDLAESATASGQLFAQEEATVSLLASGVVELVNVQIGDTVSAGELLVQLETAALERDLAIAKADVAIAQANLENQLTGATVTELASAQAAVNSAQTRLDTLLAGPTENEIAASEASVAAAQASLWAAAGNLTAVQDLSEGDIISAQAALDNALDQQASANATWVLLADCEAEDGGEHVCTPSDHAAMESVTQNVALANAQVAQAQAQLDALSSPDRNSVASAQAGVAVAQANYDAAVARHEALLLGASDADIASAEADLVSAQASLDSLLAGAEATTIRTLETRLAQAQTALAEAERALAKATLVAPFAGTVTAVSVNQGEQASGPAVTLVNNDSLEVVLSVDEVDIGQIMLDQPAAITLETWPDVEIAGAVTAIAPSAASNNSGIVAYDVHLSLGEHELPVLVGMTANAQLVTASLSDALLVPNAAINADRANGTYSVNVVTTSADGEETISEVAVTIGLRDGQFTQITSGLQAGDVVLLGQLSAPVQEFGPPGF